MLKKYALIFWSLFSVLVAYAQSDEICAGKYRWVYLQPAMTRNMLLEGSAKLGLQGSRFNIEFISDRQQVDPFRFDGVIKKNSRSISGELIPPNTEIGFIRFKGEAEAQLGACDNLPKSLWLVDTKNGGYIFLRKR